MVVKQEVQSRRDHCGRCVLPFRSRSLHPHETRLRFRFMDSERLPEVDAVDVGRLKTELRKICWQGIRDAGVARFPGVEGRIPNFIGAEAAARRLVAHPLFEEASVLKCNPDSPQRPVRHAALKAGKRIYMAVPKLAEAAANEQPRSSQAQRRMFRSESVVDGVHS